MIVVPEGVTYYLADPANRTAIDLVAASDGPPDDLTWDEIKSYYLARLSAERVRTETWLLLFDLWAATWGAAFAEQGWRVKAPRWGDYHVTARPSLANACEGGFVHHLTLLPDGAGRLVTSAVLDNAGEVQLSFYVQDANGSYNLSNSLELSADWLPDPEDDERWTRPGLARVEAGAGQIDTTRLTTLAGEAIAAVRQAI